MAKIKTPKQKNKYKALSKRLLKYVSLVMNLYDDVCKDAATLVGKTDYDGSKPFKFSDFPKLKNGLKDMLKDFVLGMRTIIYGGTSDEWKQSNMVQDLLAKDVLRYYGQKDRGTRHKVYYQTNSDALEAFQKRKDKGMGLSEKLWNQSENLKTEMEYAISSAIQKGTSAVTLSKRLSKYLEDFPKLQKDYKQKFGKAVKCKDCEYRSIRLARSEINMAYRTAEQERWRQMDFIKGYEIKTSGAHEERMPKGDICDELQGVYPKSFFWTGWHPNCMCYAIPIVMSEDEYWDKKGQQIEDLPDNYIEWVDANSDKIERMKEKGTLPYWYIDNMPQYENLENITSVNTKLHTNQINPNNIYKNNAVNDLIEKSKEKFNSYGQEWDKAYFNDYTGGYNVYNKKHQFSNTKAKDAKLTGGEAEKEVGKILADKYGKQIEYLQENGGEGAKPDIIFDGHTWDIKYISKANENTIRKYIEDCKKAERVIFYWDEENKYDLLRNAVCRTIGKYRKNNEDIDILPTVFYINKNRELKRMIIK